MSCGDNNINLVFKNKMIFVKLCTPKPSADTLTQRRNAFGKLFTIYFNSYGKMISYEY